MNPVLTQSSFWEASQRIGGQAFIIQISGFAMAKVADFIRKDQNIEMAIEINPKFEGGEWRLTNSEGKFFYSTGENI